MEGVRAPRFRFQDTYTNHFFVRSRPQKAAMFWEMCRLDDKKSLCLAHNVDRTPVNLSSSAKHLHQKKTSPRVRFCLNFPLSHNDPGYKSGVQLSSICFSFSFSHFIHISHSLTHSLHQSHLHHQPCLSEESQSSTPAPPFPTLGKPTSPPTLRRNSCTRMNTYF